MEIALLCIAATAGICAWGFLLAGAIAFHDASNTPVRGVRSILLILDILVSLGLFTMLFVVVRNWNRKPGARSLVWTGIVFVTVAVLAAIALTNW